MNLFKAAELLKIAVQIEKNGLAFYTEVKKKAKSITVQETFDYLAKQEIEHEKTFRRMLDEAGDYSQAETYPGEYALYLEALAGENIFTKDQDVKKLAKKVASDIETVQIGIGHEKDSIIFYEGMKKFLPESDLAMVENIIEEEKKHLQQLLELKKTIES